MGSENLMLTSVDALTGELETRPFTVEEKAEYESTRADIALAQQAENDKALARQSALAKLAKLGLTEAEIAAL